MVAPTAKQIEAAAKKIHDDSEKFRMKTFNQKGYGGYALTTWANLKDGYYKQNLYKLAEQSFKPKKAKR